MYIHTAGADPGFDQGGGPDRDQPKTAILGPQFCRILVLGPHFWWSGGGPGPPGPPPCIHVKFETANTELFMGQADNFTCVCIFNESSAILFLLQC